ncbi:MAG TPA: hypothetical protein VF746_05015 [Longimicrobium sp.]
MTVFDFLPTPAPASRTPRACLRAARLLVLALAAACAGPDGSAAQTSAGTRVSTAAADPMAAWREAQAHTNAGEWPRAAAAWARVAEANPHAGGAWYELGRAHFNAGDLRASIAPFERAVALGAIRPQNAALNLARAHAAQGDRDAALGWLERALALGWRSREQLWRDTLLAPLRGDARFRRLTRYADVPTDRAQGWAHDLDLLAEEVERMNPDPWRKTPREAFLREVARLKADVPRLTDAQMYARVMALLGLIGDGHTGIPPQAVPGWGNRSLPLIFRIFPDGLYVVATAPAHAALAGARVTEVAGRPAAAVLDSLRAFGGEDNERGWLRKVPWLLRYPQLLHAVGLAPDAERVRLTLRTPGGEVRTVELAVEPVDLSPSERTMGRPGWAQAFDRAPGPVPLYFKDRWRAYWFEHLPAERTVYFQFNLVRDDSAETIAAFATRLGRFLNENAVERLVVDLRWNNGGNTLLVTPLLAAIMGAPRVNRLGGVVVLADRYTYSAAMNFATYLERFTPAVFVGEPTSSDPNFIGEDNFIWLPYSRLPVGISDLFWQSSWPTDRRTWIAPQVYVEPSFADFAAKRDPVLEAALSLPIG